MGQYTVRFAHLSERPPLEVGHTVTRGQIIGTMGNTGASTAAHLHIDCVNGEQSGRYSLAMMEAGDPNPAPRQLNYFIDGELFGILPEITTFYCDPEYQRILKKIHPAYDIVPMDRHLTSAHYGIHWNRSIPGRVTAIYDATGGDGICMSIYF